MWSTVGLSSEILRLKILGVQHEKPPPPPSPSHSCYFIIHPPVLQELVCPGAEPRWSLAELIHAVILMAHAHSLSSFVWGCGLNPEPDHIGGYTFQPPSPGHLPHSPNSPAPEDGRQEVSQMTGIVTAGPHYKYKMSAADVTLLSWKESSKLLKPVSLLTFRWLRERWRWRCWWRGWWSCSSRRRSAHRRRWWLALRGRGARAFQQVPTCRFIPYISSVIQPVDIYFPSSSQLMWVFVFY